MSDLKYIKMPESNEPVVMNRACPTDCRGHIPASALESAACEVCEEMMPPYGPCERTSANKKECDSRRQIARLIRKAIGGGE